MPTDSEAADKSPIEELILAQKDYLDLILKLWVNYQKTGIPRRTVASIDARLESLKAYWQECQDRHKEILAASNAKIRTTSDYFVTNAFSAIHDCVEEVRDSLLSARAELRLKTTGSSSTEPVSETSKYPAVSLPPISLPKFSGDLTAWSGFRDLFISLVDSRPDLSNVQKLHYLKSSLEGKASQILRSTETTEANYQSAWDLLRRRYENPRAILYSYLDAFLEIPKVGANRERDLRVLRDQAHDIYHSIKSLARPISKWEDQFVHFLLTKLDKQTRHDWELTQYDVTTIPNFEALDQYLSAQLRAFETSGTGTSQVTRPLTRENKRVFVKTHQVSVSRPDCCVCSGDHPLYQCPKFSNLPVATRIEILRANDRCINCFRKGHSAKSCLSKNTCRLCKAKHHTLTHLESRSLSHSPKQSDPPSAQKNTHSSPLGQSSEASTHYSDTAATNTVLPTAQVILTSPIGISIRVRALFDQGAQLSFISESAAQSLRAKRKKSTVNISVLGGIDIGAAKYSTTFAVGPCDGREPPVTISAMIVPTLSKYQTPSFRINPDYPYLSCLTLADPNPNSNEPIQLMIGADYFGAFIRAGLVVGPPNSPMAQLTSCGWIVSGQVHNSPDQSEFAVVNLVTTNADLQSAISQFWEIEEVPSRLPLTPEEQSCEDLFVATHSRRPNGHYEVRLPLKTASPIPIGETERRVRQLLLHQENRLKKDTSLQKNYHEFLREYLDLGHMELIPENEIANPCSSYLPHHPVVKLDSSTSKVRVVFNASFASSNGSSLNDFLHTGPKLQADLFALLLQWRAYRYVMTTDLEKMFRQIFVAKPDSDLQRILWRPPDQSEILQYRLNTVTYGTACAPYLANRVIKQLAADEATNFPLAAPVLRERVYVDDVLFGANEIQSLRATRDQVKDLLRAGGFSCHKWASNVPSLLTDIPPGECAVDPSKAFGDSSPLKILGIIWDPKTDSFAFRTFPADLVGTKRSFLSLIARFYDPLGWVAPCTIAAKILMQTIWLRKVYWDDPLPADLLEQCHSIQNSLPTLHSLSLPRWTGQHFREQIIEIHGFCDASNSAYAAVVYLRCVDANGEARISLLYAKTKVAPLKVQSIPRLELCAAVLLTRALEYVGRSMTLSTVPTYCWTDSSVVLAWLRDHAARWKVFVANRVSDIQTSIPDAYWRHVPTNQNPADCASRGIKASELTNHPLWWKGPSWLIADPADWPVGNAVTADTAPERRSDTVALSTSTHATFDLADRFSNWSKMLRVVTYMLRFIHNARRNSPRPEKLSVQVWELERTTLLLCRLTQQTYYNFGELRPNSQIDISRCKSLRAISPFVDENGVIRAGGRLRFADIPYSAKYPILLPPCRLAHLLIDHMHRISLHGGLQVTLRLLRQSYWVTNARALTKSRINRCVVCVRHRATLHSQRMGELPAVRVLRSRPFNNTGVDYTGPFLIRSASGRGHKTHKCYCVIFICLVVRATHLECVSDYSTAAFLAAFDRFVSRRGLPANMYSDNGTNFVGADRELYAHFKTLTDNTDLKNRLASDSVNWHFIPPASPHFGGLWESGVKSVKHHLRRILGTFHPTFEEFSTLLAKIEAVLNSRPMVPLRDDPTSFDALTPGHFLIGSALKAVPVPSALDININRLSRWQTLQRFQQTFWRVWSNDYLNSMRQRAKWQIPKPNFRVNDLVIIKNPQLPPAKWDLARVVRTISGPDGLVRVLDLRTASSQFRRPVTQVCKLPVDTHSDDQLPTD